MDNIKLLEQVRNLVPPLFYKEDGKRVLVIGDIHSPFTVEGYFEHCIKVYEEFKCDTVVFIGDIIDLHYSSYHNADPDGYSAGEELKRAIDDIQKWYRQFPIATVIIGNHDKLAYRKAFSGGLSKQWIKDYNDVLGTPTWSFVNQLIIDNVLYIHGESGSAVKVSQNESMSVVQGHIHTEMYVNWVTNSMFALQVGCGVDRESYAMAYAKNWKPQKLGCGVVLNGEQPFVLKQHL
jgi:UDP-2,3-diacylglucosamine pyrophosphatase LpxH